MGMVDYRTHLGAHLARLRTTRGLTQMELAQRAGLHVSAVSRLEGRAGWDQVDWRVVRDVARALGKRVEEIAA